MTLYQKFRLVAPWVAIVVVAAALLIYVFYPRLKGPEPTNFFECSQLYPVAEGLPRTCRSPLGKVFEEYTGNSGTYQNDIQVTNLPPMPVVLASPLVVYGQALPSWYAGKGLTVELRAGTGGVIATTTAEKLELPPGRLASTPVPFTATLNFVSPAPNTPGALIFRKGGSNTEALVVPVLY